ncbi:WecB/TagA/CpsF family glycosyltransferase [Ilumatobacter sp.]|uniref:WecB/TagA/CpsF family glycosyltransferase n=1 Tax=Ilumatobacter sp. TaxID=1967498 RepID=UPI0037531EAC
MIATTRRLPLGGVQIDFLEPSAAADLVASKDFRGDVHLCNAYTLALAEERSDLASALDGAALNLPDGTPLAWFARRRGIDGCTRVYGPDLMGDVLDRGRSADLGHYLYGSTPEVLVALEQRIGERWPGARIVGSESPPFRDITDEELDTSLRRAQELGADIVWVGMGTPKQDLLVRRMATGGDATYVAVGAAFDFIAGVKKQAPTWMQRAGLEWLFRLVTEPRRLASRYLVYNWKFLRLLWRTRAQKAEGVRS